MQYTLIRSRRKTLSLEIKEGKILVRAPLFVGKADIERLIAKNEAWIMRQLEQQKSLKNRIDSIPRLTEPELEELKKRAKTVFPQRVALYAPQVGVVPGRISVRAQRTKWGSCSSKKNLNFNCLLLLAPSEVLDSVVVHELCHLKYMNHAKSFYEEVLRICPDYKSCDRWLKEHGSELMARLPKQE